MSLLPVLLACAQPGHEQGAANDAPKRAIDLPTLAIGLEPVAEGFELPVDIQPAPDGRLVIVEKVGRVTAIDLASGQRQVLLERDVAKGAEQGLLGLAWHPSGDGRLYLDYVAEEGKLTRVTEVPDLARPAVERVLLEVPQPAGNHNGGQIAFGPDGMLYVALGDGGGAGDPNGSGQDPSSLLGSILRIDVDAEPGPGLAYAVPADNPLVGRQGARPEIWAMGLRNPWRFSFHPDGRLIVGDVGQGAWEEVDVVGRGDNLGWNLREGRHCFKPRVGCEQEGLVEPVFEYDRSLGSCVTGGYVATGPAAPSLVGRYVLGDFVSGRLIALDLPAAPGDGATAWDLGKWGIHPSTFGRDAAGDLYVADLPTGAIYRLTAPAER